jgi:hypothetical protein
MPIVKRKDNMVKSQATLPIRQMITYEWCIKASDVLNPPLHWKDDHKKDNEHVVAEERTIQQILEKLLMGVGSEAEGRLMDQEMRGLAKKII